MSRLEILKTYKIYIGGKFPRTESGRYYTPKDKKGKVIANVCLCSRKDFREAVLAARAAFAAWSEKSAFNRSQILYRIAEMLEGRKSQFIEELIKQGSSTLEAKKEVETAIERLVYYSGWCDKFQQVYSSVNPVSSSHFNFSANEAMGVVSVLADEKTSLLGLVSVVAPIIAGGNTLVILASESKPLCAVSFAEVLSTSDLSSGVVNILTGNKSELAEQFASHMDVNAVVYCGSDKKIIYTIEQAAVDNVKRVRNYPNDWTKAENESPYFILDFQEVKTTWHPIENIGGSGSNY